jgi:signal transduction histidine kinase
VLLVAIAAALGVAGLLVRLALRRGLRRLDDLSAEVEQMGAGALHRRLTTPTLLAELRGVGERLNDLIARLEASFERERRFNSDIAHELRTPPAEIRASAELGATWAEEATSARCAESVEVANELTALLEKLALLSRGDGASARVGRVPLAIRPAVEAVFGALRVGRRRAIVAPRGPL